MRKLGALIIAFVGLTGLASAPTLLIFPAITLGSLASGATLDSSTGTTTVALIIGFLPFVIAVAFGVTLIANRERLSRRLFDDSPAEFLVDPRAIAKPVVALVGLSMSAGALAAFLGSTVQVVQRFATVGPELGGSKWLLFSSSVPSIVAQLVTVAIGLVLVYRSGPLARRLVGPDEPDV